MKSRRQRSIGNGYGASGRQVGPYSRVIDRGAVGTAIDGRSREGRYLRQYEKMLNEHVGGKPSIVQRMLIQRAARLALHLELMDEQVLSAGKVLTTHDHNFYASWSNALARVLARLGIEPAYGEPRGDLQSYLSDRYGDEPEAAD